MSQLKFVLIISISISSFFVGCANGAVSQDKDIQPYSNSSTKTSESSKLKKSPKISLIFEGKGEKKHLSLGITQNFPADADLDIIRDSDYNTYIYNRNDRVFFEFNEDKQSFVLNQIKKDTQWVLVNGLKKIDKTKAENQIESLLSKTIQESERFYGNIRYAKDTSVTNWHIYSLNLENSNLELLSHIRIHNAPFLLGSFIKKYDSDTFREFFPESSTIEENDSLQLRIKTYEDVYVCIFMRDENGKPYQIFPSKDVKYSPLLRGGKNYLVTEPYIFPLGRQELYCLYHDKKMNCAELAKIVNEHEKLKGPVNIIAKENQKEGKDWGIAEIESFFTDPEKNELEQLNDIKQEDIGTITKSEQIEPSFYTMIFE